MPKNINQIIENLKQKERTYHQQKGRLDQLMRQLDEAGFDSLDDAKGWLEDTSQEIDEEKKLRDIKFKTFVEKYGRLL